MKDNQFKYIIKTLSRTKRKDYENYCVNRIWTLLNRTDIKPVTQSYVQFDNGNYALLDLHFPSLNYAIEIDESHHKKQKLEDVNRSEKIKEQFKTYRHNDLIIRRIDINQGMTIVHQQIDDIVFELKTIIEKSDYQEIKWHDKTEDEQIAFLKDEGVISVNDDIHFHTIKKACELFDIYYKDVQRSYFKLKSNPNYTIWFPKEATLKNGAFSPNNTEGWVNIMDPDNEEITSYNTDDETVTNDPYMDKPKITFMKINDPITNQREYVFVGVFKILEEDRNNKVKRRYKRIRTTFNLEEINNFI